MKALQQLWEIIRITGSFVKIRITAAVTATAFTGYIVFNGSFSIQLLPLLTGIFFLAAGSSALNHYQERDIDARMERTRTRPIPSGTVSPSRALLFASILLITGSLLLFLYFPPAVLFLGLFNFFWYNAIYTPLKRITAFAVIPGSVTGGVPPLIGWVATGGNIPDPEIIAIVLFFIIGQIPHFWLLLLKYGAQYESAGIPSLTGIFTSGQIKRISYTWIFAAVAASLLLPLHGLITSPILLTALFLGITMLAGIILRQELTVERPVGDKPAFIILNIFYLLVMVLMTLEAILY
jgi:heme o synthase